LNIEEQKRHFANVAEAMHQLSIAIEPLFKAGPEVVAPGTDWWAIVAGDRHCSIAAARMYKDMSEQVDRERTEDTGPLAKLMKSQRAATLKAHELQGPCASGCMLSWAKQYGIATE